MELKRSAVVLDKLNKRFLLVVALILLAGCGGSSNEQPDLAGEPPATGEMKLIIAELESTQVPNGVTPHVFAELQAELKRVLEAQGGLKAANSPPLDDRSATQLSLDAGTGELSWRYYFTGDYDQNCEVNIADLTPLGQHFGKVGPFDPDSVEAVVDGDNNGVINIADVTPIGVSFGSLLTVYNIYSSASLQDAPVSNAGSNGMSAAREGIGALADASGNAGVERLSFSYTLASNPAGMLYWVRPSDGSTDGTPSNTVMPEGDTLTHLGGTTMLDGIMFSTPPSGLVSDVVFGHQDVPIPPNPPDGFVPVGGAHDISVDHPEWLNAPVLMEIPYDDTGLSPEQEDNMLVLHYDGAEYGPVTLLDQDTAANTLTFDSRDFSVFLAGYMTAAALMTFVEDFNTGFSAGTDGWEINNFGSYFSPGGNCLGMSAYAVWFKAAKPEKLWGKFSTESGAPTSIAHLTATRAHLAQSQYWGLKFHWYEQKLSEAKIGKLLKYFLTTFQQPLILSMLGPTGGHASVVHGWNATGFKFYDVNTAGASQQLPWSSEAGFGNYSDFTTFGFVCSASMGRTEDFAALTTEAEGGFISSGDITMQTPTPSQEINGHKVFMEGTLSGSLNDSVKMVCYAKGVPITVPIDSADHFFSYIPISSGTNTLIVLAGADLDDQSNWYRNGATLIRDVEGTAKKSDLLVTLTWNQGWSDVDLYVTEPGTTQAWYNTAWFGNKLTLNGMSLDFDNTEGYGPEHITLSAEDGDVILPGNYTIRVHFYKDVGGAAPVDGNVSVLLHEGTPKQKFYSSPFVIGEANKENSEPGSTGFDWKDIATVQLVAPST